MVRRKPVEPSPEELDQQPPRELLRFVPSQPPLTNAEGRPKPWHVEWTADEFAAWPGLVRRGATPTVSHCRVYPAWSERRSVG